MDTKNNPPLPVTKTINPKTKEVDLMGAINYVITELNDGEILKKGRHFHKLRGGFSTKLAELGIDKNVLPDFSIIMQHLGFVKVYGTGTNAECRIADTSLLRELFIKKYVDAAVKKRHQEILRNRETRRLKEKIAKLEEILKGFDASLNSNTCVENVEEAGLERISKLEEENAKLRKKLDKLTRKKKKKDSKKKKKLRRSSDLKKKQ